MDLVDALLGRHEEAEPATIEQRALGLVSEHGFRHRRGDRDESDSWQRLHRSSGSAAW